MALEAGQKFSHQACNYRPGSPGESCGNCHHFTDPGCEIVEDPIAAEMVCDFHAPAQSGAPVGMGMPTGRPF